MRNRFMHPRRYLPPAEIASLPFDLLRSHLYPRRPDIVAHAIEAGPRAVDTTFLPQRMAFRRWKRPPWNADYRSAIAGPVHAVRESGSLARQVGAFGTFVQPIGPRAATFVRLPQPSDNMADFSAPVIARGVPRHADRVPPTALDQIAVEQSQLALSNNVERSLRTQRAISQIQGIRAVLRGLTGRG